MLELHSIRKSFGDRDILRDVNFVVGERQRVALAGANGVGKSTLFKIILREIEADGGEVRLPPWASVSYLPQDARCTGGNTLHEELLTVFAQVREVEERQRTLEREMRRLAPGDPRLMRLVAEHGHLHEEFERLDGYTVEAEIGKVLAGLGFSIADRDKLVGEFSGGWQTRIALAKLLLQRPSLLLLDEPTNHLDLAAIAWLEEYLREYRGTVIVVSHDRYFLDRVTQRTIELEEGAVEDWAGSYSFYVKEKAKRREARGAAFKRQQEYIATQQAFVERFRASARRSAQAKSRERALEKLELVEAPRKAGRSRFRFAPHRPSGREVFMLKGVAKGYDGQTVFADCDLLLERGEKVALVGENGAGKTTLLRLLMGMEKPDRGTVRLGLNVQRSFYAQHQADSLDEGNTVLDEVYAAAPTDWSTGEVRSLLGRFGISEGDVFKRVEVLSGGERSRVALAKMLLQPANALLLDEPTNHLDIAAREMLEEALVAYDGTVVLVSHDRYFVDKVATKVVALADETVRVYDGNYSFYLARKTREAAHLAAAARAAPNEPKRAPEVKRGAAPSLEKQLGEVEQEIGELEAKLGRLAEELSSPEYYNEPERSAQATARYHEVEARLEALNGRWEALARAVEQDVSAWR